MFATLTFALITLLAPVAQAAPPVPVKVVAVSASSALPKWQGYTFDAANLIDGRVDTSWQPAKKDAMGVGQWIELDLGAPHALSSVQIALGLQKVDPKLGDLFCRNNRFAVARLYFDDGSYAPVWAPPSDTTVDVEQFYRGEALPGKEVKVVTRYIRLVIQSVHDPVDWKDIAIAEVRVFGTPAPATPVDATSIAWDRPGAWPLKVAIIDFCAVNVELRSKRDCAALVGAIAEGRAFDRGYKSVAPFAVADFTKNAVVQTLSANGAQHRLELVGATDGRWSVKRHTRLDTSGKVAERALENLIEADLERQNKCWEKLGKERPDDSEERGEKDPN